MVAVGVQSTGAKQPFVPEKTAIGVPSVGSSTRRRKLSFGGWKLTNQPSAACERISRTRFRFDLLSVGGEVRLPPGQAKNREPRVFPMTAELRQVLVAQRAYVDAIQRERQRIIPWVWVWPDGRPVRDIRGSWKRACVAAGVPGRIPHDFRRTAVRNLERAGVPRSVAMKMVGHKTEAVYRRYAIVAEADLRDAARRLDALADTGVPATKTATVGPKAALLDGRTPAN